MFRVTCMALDTMSITIPPCRPLNDTRQTQNETKTKNKDLQWKGLEEEGRTGDVDVAEVRSLFS